MLCCVAKLKSDDEVELVEGAGMGVQRTQREQQLHRAGGENDSDGTEEINWYLT